MWSAENIATHNQTIRKHLESESALALLKNVRYKDTGPNLVYNIQ